MDCGGRVPTAEARDCLAGVARGTLFLAGVTGTPLADQFEIERAGPLGGALREGGNNKAHSELVPLLALLI
jgi:hypothetical protein